MTDAREETRQQYAKTRAEFEKLGIQDKTAFVLEATFATIGRAIEEAGRQVADAFDHAAHFDFGPWRAPDDESDTPAADAPAKDGTNPAEPPSAAKRAPAEPKRGDDAA